jgi:peptidoglycan/xylan/chitin deacetylase (PgdA/CDA1 family)
MGIDVFRAAMACSAMLASAALAGDLAGSTNRVAQPSGRHNLELREGAIIRGPTSVRRLAFAFTGHSYAEGGEIILNELARHQAKGSFFFTGEFLTNASFRAIVQRVVAEGHYLGPHSDRHLLYCPWEGPKRTLVAHAAFQADLDSNLKKIEGFGVKRPDIRYFIPPYEHYNQQIVDWSKAMGLALVNFTPGTRSNADYTGEADSNFVSSQAIFDSIVRQEEKNPNGLNGFILLLHIGSGPGRADKFPARFGALLDHLAGKGYGLVRMDELLATIADNASLRR